MERSEWPLMRWVIACTFIGLLSVLPMKAKNRCILYGCDHTVEQNGTLRQAKPRNKSGFTYVYIHFGRLKNPQKYVPCIIGARENNPYIRFTCKGMKVKNGDICRVTLANGEQFDVRCQEVFDTKFITGSQLAMASPYGYKYPHNPYGKQYYFGSFLCLLTEEQNEAVRFCGITRLEPIKNK